ncbi:MAG: GntR family transcriptional regulator [Bacteroidetes bacterium]|nr:GntR family transcriptional regulator [Bacteroidota bacterium]
MEIGRVNNLTIKRKVEFGFYLLDEKENEVLLPNRYAPPGCEIGQTIDVFIYLDSEDRIIATTEKPFAQLDSFAFLNVVDVNTIGAFLDWGLPKNLLVPFKEQKHKMEVGKSYVVFIYLDDTTGRVVASSKLDKFLDKKPTKFEENQEVDLLVFQQTDMGFKAIINDSHQGVLYKNEVFQSLKYGDSVKGYIYKVREDGKIDLILHKPGYEKIDSISKQILDTLAKYKGFIDLDDNSSPEDIYRVFKISKKTYKKAIGALYKARLITIEQNGIKIVR